jgi:hypothetical protein
MSAWGLGRDSGAGGFRVANEKDNALQTFVGRVLTFIPTDVVALYAAAIAAFVTDPTKGSSWLLVPVFFVLCPIAVAGGAFSAGESGKWWTRRTRFRTIVAPIAFIIWSPTVPNSGWEQWHVVAIHPRWTVLICAIAGYVFALIAGGFDKRIPD